MTESSAAYKTAVVADARRTYIRAVINIIDPDIVFGSPSVSSDAGYSQLPQLVDAEFVTGDNYTTMEKNRWLLNGSFDTIPDSVPRQVGAVTAGISGADGAFTEAQTATISFSGVETLQVITLQFSENPYDGIPEDFVVTCGSQTFTRTGNTKTRVEIDGFTVTNPTSISISVTKWSMPNRHARIIEIFPGLHEEWSGEDVYQLSVNQQANFAAAALPYGTATLSVDNTTRRFEPTAPDGIFRSIEERQGIDLSVGVLLETGAVEYKPLGRYYQYSGGWKTGQNAMTIQWSLVDIVGLLADREYIPPSTLPTTAGGWIASVAAQLGGNFTSEHTADAALSSVSLSPDNRASVTGKRCADILSWVAMAAGGYITADAATGKLALKQIRSTGGTLALDDLEKYPVVRANDDLGAIVFTLHDGNGTKFTFAGNAAASSATLSIDNPFIKTQAAAQAVAERILKFYGGNAFETVGRGDPAAEIGDVDTIAITRTQNANGRRFAQSFSFSGGVLKSCQSKFIEVKSS